ncbi:MAG: phosphatase PAP2 family protein [Melioribacteraceae bacterium]
MSAIKYFFNNLLFLFFVLMLTLNAQNKYNISQFSDESIKFIKQPLTWEKKDWIKLGAVSVGTILTMYIDQPVRDEYLINRNYYKSFPIEFGRKWGEIYTTVIIGGAFGLYGLIEDDNSTKRIGYEIFQTAFYSGIITQFLKISLGRARPFTNNGSNFYKPFTLFNDDFHSMPSGHATLAFALSTILSENTDSKFLKIAAYIPAVLTAVSRVYQDNHWTSDVLLGAAVGYFVGNWVHKIHDSKVMNNESIEFYNTQNFQWISIKIIF